MQVAIYTTTPEEENSKSPSLKKKTFFNDLYVCLLTKLVTPNEFIGKGAKLQIHSALHTRAVSNYMEIVPIPITLTVTDVLC